MTSLLNNIFDLEGLVPTSTNQENDQLLIKAEMVHASICCPKCSHTTGLFKGKIIRKFHLPPIGSKKCFLEATLHRVMCHRCQNLYSPILPFMQGRRKMSRSFIIYALDLLKFGTIKDVADHLGVGWDAIKEIHTQELERKYEDIPISGVEYLAIDEFSIKKRHKYMTVISDMKTGRIIHAIEGRKQEDIEPFLQKLKKKP